MLVTAVEEYTKKKFKIYIDWQFAFVLYKGELRRYGIEKDKNITEEIYNEIINDVIIKRAKRRVMYLLKSMNRTEGELRKKLSQGFYPEVAQDAAIEYVKSYNYVNDREYARQYVEYKSSSKGVRRIKMELKNKGISDSIINDILDDNEIDDAPTIIKLIKKKNYNINTEDMKEKNKMYMYLARRGFSFQKIEEAVNIIKNSSDVN